MQIIRVNRSRPSRAAIDAAVAVLMAGGIVAYPTDTAYGLAADPEDAQAIEKIFTIKGREPGKPLPLIAGSMAQAVAFVRLAGVALTLACRHWPGPLTVVAPIRSVALRRRLAADFPPDAAVRVPDSVLAQTLAVAFGHPITSTSANLSGHPAPYSSTAVSQEFADRAVQPDLLLDAGSLPLRPVSTIIKVVRGKIKVLREGAIRL